MPTKEELLSIGENLPAGIDRDAFPAVTDKEKDKVSAAVVFYWSSTPHPQSDSMAWAARYAVMGAQAVLQTRSSRHLVRCVRKQRRPCACHTGGAGSSRGRGSYGVTTKCSLAFSPL